MDKSRFYRSIPKVDILLEDDRIQEAIARFDRDTVMDAVREQTEFVREQIRTLDEENTLCILVDGLIPEIIRRVEKMHTPDMRPVINATGTVLHTNLGRAPISREHMARLAEVACGYCRAGFVRGSARLASEISGQPENI